jgi:hypothetical protein
MRLPAGHPCSQPRWPSGAGALQSAGSANVRRFLDAEARRVVHPLPLLPPASAVRSKVGAHLSHHRRSPGNAPPIALPSTSPEPEPSHEKMLTVPEFGATPAGASRRGSPQTPERSETIAWREGVEKVVLVAGGPVRRHRQPTTFAGLWLTRPNTGPPSWPAAPSLALPATPLWNTGRRSPATRAAPREPTNFWGDQTVRKNGV